MNLNSDGVPGEMVHVVKFSENETPEEPSSGQGRAEVLPFDEIRNSIGDWNSVETLPDHGDCVPVTSNLSSEDKTLIQNAVEPGFVQGQLDSIKDESLFQNAVLPGSVTSVQGQIDSTGVLESVEQFPVESPGLEMKVADANGNQGIHVFVGLPSEVTKNKSVEEGQADSDENHVKEVNVSEAGVFEHSGNKLNICDLVVDLNSYVSLDGKWKSGAGCSTKETEAKDKLGDAAYHRNWVASNGNKDGEFGKPEIAQPKDDGKNLVKSVASKWEYSVSDLVWGKVRSHPWWPGQIFNSSDSSKTAMKYFKQGNILIAYFGDGTFAWNGRSQLKPFGVNFSQMEKQSNLEAFRGAVDCALDEISRRVEFGLACSCLPKEEYTKIKSQIIVNSGIRHGSRKRDSNEEYSTAALLEPVKLVEYIKTLARSPNKEVDRLELVLARAQLSSFYRRKGYPLPEFRMLGGFLEDGAGILFPGNEKHCSDAVLEFKDKEQVPTGNGKLKNQDSSCAKRKRSSDGSINPRKEEQTLSDFIARKRSYSVNGENENKAGSKLTSSSSSKKRKVVESIYESKVKKQILLSTGASTNSPMSKQSFGVGESICKVASQLNGSSPILKHADGTSEKTIIKYERKAKHAKVSFAASPSGLEKSHGMEKVGPTKCSSPDDMISQLRCAAIDPMKRYDNLIPMVSFLTDFRNSVSLGNPSQYLEDKYCSKSGEKSSKSETTKTAPALEYVEDSFWTDSFIKSIPEEQLSLANQIKSSELPLETRIEKGSAIVESSHNLESEQQEAVGNFEFKEEKDENSKETPTPTALILHFTDIDSVPSIAKLNEIFSHYGSLNESSTEVVKKSNRAKVVFKRRVDAETAFSSSGKFSIFGPSLVRYCLKYAPLTPRKAASTPARRRSRKDAKSVEGNAP